jgi:hypothetical protein
VNLESLGSKVCIACTPGTWTVISEHAITVDLRHSDGKTERFCVNKALLRTAALWRAEHPCADVPDAISTHGQLEDTSWHNDVCPSFMRKGDDHEHPACPRLFVDYADNERREMPGGPRYHAFTLDGTLFETDDMAEAIERFLALPRVLLPPRTPDVWARLIEHAVARAKNEIMADERDGTLPVGIRDFATLHDHVDANCYGGLCDGTFIEEDADGNMTDACQDAANLIQSEIHSWLQSRGPLTYAQARHIAGAGGTVQYGTDGNLYRRGC